MLKGKHILLGITGSIAAYKAALLVRALVKQGAEVRVIMTEMAKQFITPLTMATLSKNPILVEFYNPENGDWNSHISLGMWADAYLIAPASANTIAKMATGVADNLLLTTYLSARCPVIVAPAMDVDMYLHTATQNNIETLALRGVKIIDPNAGELASGLEGKGRMAEPEEIAGYMNEFFSRKESLKDINVLINAGPTREAIDPVRYISNHSTGKMGYAIAEEFACRGAMVTLVSGPVNLFAKSPRITVRNVTTANEMYSTTLECYKEGKDITILCAAVADFTPVHSSDLKIKREKENYNLELEPTKDIAAEIGKIKRSGSVIVGFALETNNELSNAEKKLKTKGLDAIVLNSLKDSGAGFGVNTNKISIIARGGEITHYPLKSKEQVARDIADYIENLLLCSKA
ncbi:MAG: bifunctional phosphopantothenoylcysteine decarboxylase/phosphopantothenate--cysteine ligase CoaBC [Bacteroidales bacterium]|nr:bifunctional phosphopantothenoylcysteine decarboxylase/phosphopantothenate--cysteine ligase CoaBC [Bacteroidales bacterium]MDD4292593.1 bifunctional phosphopantothenoylcysteine decarboxylase/phosphopantothenate--cysteine ligase CoaBC [Bacteroidales bacterium]MDD4492605.1 bifunctional phosphopantothenoylcysteine decarboxylase/phosphopantothenate--cysteine ligase CoaBC [Bacteroidales bacterium]